MKLFSCLILFTILASVFSNPAPLFKKLKSGFIPLGGVKLLGLSNSKDDCVEEKVREVQVIQEKPVIQEVIREVPVTIIREETFERIVKVDRPYDVIKEVPVERIIHVDRPYEVIKEVPVDVIVRKRVEVPVEVQVPVAVPHEKIVEVPVPVEKVRRVERPVYVQRAAPLEEDCVEENEIGKSGVQVGLGLGTNLLGGGLLKKLKSHL